MKNENGVSIDGKIITPRKVMVVDLDPMDIFFGAQVGEGVAVQTKHDGKLTLVVGMQGKRPEHWFITSQLQDID
jgi:archaellum component FlaG (FlaF/FlaG flagellin family)